MSAESVRVLTRRDDLSAPDGKAVMFSVGSEPHMEVFVAITQDTYEELGQPSLIVVSVSTS